MDSNAAARHSEKPVIRISGGKSGGAMIGYTNGTGPGVTPFESLSIAQLADFDFPAVDWTIDDLIPSGSLGLMVGRPKLGKSLLAIDALASVAIGEPFIGRATTQGPAIYVPAEDALRLVRDRVLNRLKGDRSVPFHIIPADGSFDQSIRFDDAESLSRLAATIEALQPRIVVLDPMREFHQLREDKADDMALMLRPLRQMAHELDVAVLLIHHRNKHATDPSKAARGSSAIAGGVDLILTLEMTDESDDAELDGNQVLRLYVEGRYGPRQRLAARLRTGLRWEETDPRLTDDVPVRERVLRHLEVTGEALTVAELIEAVQGTQSRIQRALKSLVEDGAITRQGAGTKTQPFTYQHASPEPAENEAHNTRIENFCVQTGKTADSMRLPIHSVSVGAYNPDDVLKVARQWSDDGWMHSIPLRRGEGLQIGDGPPITDLHGFIRRWLPRAEEGEEKALLRLRQLIEVVLYEYPNTAPAQRYYHVIANNRKGVASND
jgi:predicted transcriptional regulator